MTKKKGKSSANLEVNGVRGIPLQPFKKPNQNFLQMARDKKRALFIDLVASPEMKEAINALEKQNVAVVAYRDHHYAPDSENENDKKTIESVREIIAKLGDKARFETRESSPSCSRLVELGEAIREKIDLVLFHGDTDGFFGYLKAVGVTYEGMDQDADILDGNGDESKLTKHGKLFHDALVSLPKFDRKRPYLITRATHILREEFIAYLKSNFSEETKKPLLEKTRRPYKRKIDELRKIMAWLVKDIAQEIEKITESKRGKKQQTLF